MFEVACSLLYTLLWYIFCLWYALFVCMNTWVTLLMSRLLIPYLDMMDYFVCRIPCYSRSHTFPQAYISECLSICLCASCMLISCSHAYILVCDFWYRLRTQVICPCGLYYGTWVIRLGYIMHVELYVQRMNLDPSLRCHMIIDAHWIVCAQWC